jgi:hypothetical protein
MHRKKITYVDVGYRWFLFTRPLHAAYGVEPEALGARARLLLAACKKREERR